jgi:anti-sigma-K factor RskA
MAEGPDLLAAEYVLGTLSPEERREFGRALTTDPMAAAAVHYWSERLGPLAAALPDVPPPARLWSRIEALTDPSPANDNAAVGRWRIAAIAASLLALAMTGVAIRDGSLTPAREGPAIAALSRAGGEPALLVTYDPAARRLNLAPLDLPERPGHSLELWMIEGQSAPHSMGVLSPGGRPSFSGVAIDPKSETVFAISVEPLGGSPTGAPTGPVVYSGRLVTLAPAT